jgi:hypothetical protein
MTQGGRHVEHKNDDKEDERDTDENIAFAAFTTKTVARGTVKTERETQLTMVSFICVSFVK